MIVMVATEGFKKEYVFDNAEEVYISTDGLSLQIKMQEDCNCGWIVTETKEETK